MYTLSAASTCPDLIGTIVLSACLCLAHMGATPLLLIPIPRLPIKTVLQTTFQEWDKFLLKGHFFKIPDTISVINPGPQLFSISCYIPVNLAVPYAAL